MEKQRFIWAAILDDDSVILEFEPDGKENMYRDIPREKVKIFGLQSSQSSYFIDLSTGKFNVKDFRQNRGLDISIPYDKKIISLTGALPGFQRYSFFQYKSGYQDMARRPGEKAIGSSGNVITEHVIGWNRQIVIKRFGLVNVQVSLTIDPRPKVIEPILKVTLTPPGASKAPIAGSPYVINL